jgi:hypothetical protein
MRLTSCFALVLALGATACNGQILDGSPNVINPPPAQPDSGAPAQPDGGTPPPEPGEPVPPPNADVGRVGLHRLNNQEYANTIHDLLGVSYPAPQNFVGDEKGPDFDNDAESLIVTDVRYEQYFVAADAIATQAFADAGLKARVLTCAPATATDTTCTKQIISRFGLRAWRRPLETAEIDRLAKVAADAQSLGEDFAGSIRQVVTVMLAVPQFLFRIEGDPNPGSAARHALTPYELASRLSYLTWSTMPDDALFARAASGELLRDDVLASELDRLLTDARGARFTESFAGQWLGIRAAAAHQVEPTAFPDYDPALRDALVGEALAYFQHFVTTDRDLGTFFTSDLNFVNARLARHYGMPAVTGDALVKVEDTSDERQGFMGLGAFLTQSSFSYRTAPTLRGRWVLENMLCTTIPPPMFQVPKIDNEKPADPASQNLNVAARLAEHRDNDDCRGCHMILDPIGIGLENFDAIGRYRTTYADGAAVDASGKMPSGEPFNGLRQLNQIVAKDRRFFDCTSNKALSYALGRAVTDADKPFLEQIRYRWRHQGTSVRALLKSVVASDPFRYRRGEP